MSENQKFYEIMDGAGKNVNQLPSFSINKWQVENA